MKSYNGTRATIIGTMMMVMVLLNMITVQSYFPETIHRRYTQYVDNIQVKTRKISSERNVPFNYYSMPYCEPQKRQRTTENLGEYLFGDRIENSVYEFKVGRDVKCQLIKETTENSDPKKNVVCPPLSAKDVENIKKKVKDNYIGELIMDGLPIASSDKHYPCGSRPPTTEPKLRYYDRPEGYSIGCKSGNDIVFHNHLSFFIKYNTDSQMKYSIVGVEAIPSSIKHDAAVVCQPDKPIESSQPLLLSTLKENDRIPFSYSVKWVYSQQSFASRWDYYLSRENSDSTKIHWFSIVNSLMIVLFLTTMVGLIMLRILNKDIAYYNRDDEEDQIDERGWKLVHTDVFRSPRIPILLSIFVGSGAQLFAMTCVALFLCLFSIVSPSSRGSIFTAFFFLYILFGYLNGYVTLRMYKMMKGTHWKTASVLSACLIPGSVFVVFLFINILFALSRSSGAVPFLELLLILFFWVGVSIPLVFIGAFFGFKKPTITQPVETHEIPRQIPDQPVYMKPPVSYLLGGILPFGAVFIQLYFVMSSIWLHQYYFLLPLLFLVFLILVVTCAEITFIMIYFQLCNLDYNWWWNAFFTSGSSAFYLLIYSLFYYFTKLNIDSFVMTLVYFLYMTIIAYIFFILTGTVGFVSTLFFLRKIYSSVRVN